jgi:hypothetical protein
MMGNQKNVWLYHRWPIIPDITTSMELKAGYDRPVQLNRWKMVYFLSYRFVMFIRLHHQCTLLILRWSPTGQGFCTSRRRLADVCFVRNGARVNITTFISDITNIFKTWFVRNCESRWEGICVSFYPRKAVCRHVSKIVRTNCTGQRIVCDLWNRSTRLWSRHWLILGIWRLVRTRLDCKQMNL